MKRFRMRRCKKCGRKIASRLCDGCGFRNPVVKRNKAKKKPTFSKKDWNEIFLRAASTMLISVVTQAFKRGVPLTFGRQPIKEANFLLPPTVVTTTHHPKKRTRNPAYDRRRKGKARGSD